MKRKTYIIVSILIVILAISLTGCAKPFKAEEIGIKLDSTKEIVRIETIGLMQYEDNGEHPLHYIDSTDENFEEAKGKVIAFYDNLEFAKKKKKKGPKTFQLNVIYDDETTFSVAGLQSGIYYESTVWLKIDNFWYETNKIWQNELESLVDIMHSMYGDEE